MRILSCTNGSAPRPGAHGDALGAERCEVLERHVLVVEGHDVAAGCERPQVVVASGSRRRRSPGATRAAESSAVSASTRSRTPQRDRGLLGHPGELPAADHADHGQPGDRVAHSVLPRSVVHSGAVIVASAHE